VTDQDRAQSVAHLLEKFLLERDDYAKLWQNCQKRARPVGALNQAAIAQVIAEYLWDTGERLDTETDLPRILKDPVHRALQGKGISPQMLTWFIKAFEMTEVDARQLRTALIGPLSLNETPVTDTLRLPQELPIPQRHRTLAVFERRVIGPNGAPVAHHASRAILAHQGTVSFYPCRQLASAAEVQVLCGGTVTARHEPPGSSPILEITLSRPLPAGQVASLEYQASFGPSASVVTEYRQVAHARANNVDIVVQFSHERLPRQVWWAIWDDHHGGTILAEHPVPLDPGGRVHRYLPYLENAAVGFRWEW
jgi:hypothetical protein